MKDLKKDIKDKNIKQVYLFYGEEHYLIKMYLNNIKNAIIDDDINFNLYEGNIAIAKIIDTLDTLPFFSQSRLVFVKESNLFTSNRKEDAEVLSNYLDDILETSTLIFVEKEIDKRTKLYKKIKSINADVEFKKLTPKDLATWCKKLFNDAGKQIADDVISKLIFTVSTDMQNLENEINKLICYNQEVEITSQAIDNICTKSLELEVFEMVEAISLKNIKKSTEIYNNLILMKEEPFKIFALIIRQFRLMLHAKLLVDDGFSYNEIAKEMGLAPFIVTKLLKQIKSYNSDELFAIYTDCLNTDINIKSGFVSAEFGVSLFILKRG